MLNQTEDCSSPVWLANCYRTSLMLFPGMPGPLFCASASELAVLLPAIITDMLETHQVSIAESLSMLAAAIP